MGGRGGAGHALAAVPIDVSTESADVSPAPRPGPVPTWDELGRPQGPAPVGEPIGHEGGTYELLPGEPRRYRVIGVDGQDLSERIVRAPGRHQTADDARTVLRVDAADRRARDAAVASGQVDAWDAIPGSWSYDGTVAGFGRAKAGERERIRAALRRWATHNGTAATEVTRMAEPPVNQAVRGAIPHDDTSRADMASLDRALELSKTKRPITVYRGISDGSHILPDDWQTRDLTGLEWAATGYTPVTGNADSAETYAGLPEHRGFAIRLHLPKASPAVAIRDDPGAVDDEGEILLPRGLRFRVTGDSGVQGAYGIRWLDVEISDRDTQ